LAHHRLTFLAREADFERKRGVYEFPREVKRVRGAIVQFMVDVFKPNPLQPGPLLRGFYFTGLRPVPARSARESWPLDRTASASMSDATTFLRGDQLKAEMERASGRVSGTAASPEPVVDRWCFASQLFNDILQTGAAPVRHYTDRRTDMYRRIAFGAI